MKSTNTIPVLGIIILLYLICTYLLQEVVLTQDHYYASFEAQMSYQSIEDLLTFKIEWMWLGYILIPIILFIKFGIISICLLAGAFLFDIRISLKKLFHIVVISESILLLPLVVKIIWFIATPSSYTLEDVQLFYPLSLLSLFDPHTLDSWWLYPLQVLNLFELLYWITLALLLRKVVNASFDRRLGLVLSSYGSGLLIWVIFITFITLNIS